MKKKVDAGEIIVAVLFMIVCYPAACVVVVLWNLGDMIVTGADYYGGAAILLGALGLSILAAVALLISEHKKSDEQKRVEAEFNRDKTAICPHCGSRNIQVYPKGYNYKAAFFGHLAGSKSAPLLGAIGSTKACCRCRNCGKGWQTPYDYTEL